MSDLPSPRAQGFILGMILAMVMAVWVAYVTSNIWRAEAIAHHVAHWAINSVTGNSSFVWDSPVSPPNPSSP